MEFEQVGRAFVDFYYQTFDTDRTQLLSMYGADSMMTFEGTAVQGPELIVQKFLVCGFAKIFFFMTDFLSVVSYKKAFGPFYLPLSFFFLSIPFLVKDLSRPSIWWFSPFFF
jgi:hypothetical protein